MPAARAIAFYLPQFYPLAENSEWWGPGFTEWTNVARARPLFPGHVQPNLPADLGFYDLRVAETREHQARLAATYGIEAFCYWHYWFAGRRLLDRPFTEVLRSKEPSLPFCLAWANQTWSGVWHGAPGRVLVEQTYPGEADDLQHFEAVLPAFIDSRYLRVNGKPLFYVFRPEQLPDARAFTDRWRAMASRAGLPGMYLVAEMSDLLGRGTIFPEPRQHGFDAGVYMRLPAENATRRSRLKTRLRMKLLRHPEVYRYSRTPILMPPAARGPHSMPCVYPNWDNTPRSGRGGLVLSESSPALFAVQVRAAIAALQEHPPEERLLFVKSWNEWAEGNHLEPDQRFRHGFLEALAAELLEERASSDSRELRAGTAA